MPLVSTLPTSSPLDCGSGSGQYAGLSLSESICRFSFSCPCHCGERATCGHGTSPCIQLHIRRGGGRGGGGLKGGGDHPSSYGAVLILPCLPPFRHAIPIPPPKKRVSLERQWCERLWRRTALVWQLLPTPSPLFYPSYRLLVQCPGHPSPSSSTHFHLLSLIWSDWRCCKGVLRPRLT